MTAATAAAAGGGAGRVAAAKVGGSVVVLAAGGPARPAPVRGTKGAEPIAYLGGGRLLSYTRNGGVFVAKAGGGDPRKIIGNAHSPAWSPSGRYLVFTRFTCAPLKCIQVNNPSEIFLLDVRTKKVRRLTQNGIYDGSPTWSPDGKLILFVQETGLFVMRADGSNLYSLLGGQWFNPRWSPDGSRIAMDNFRDVHALSLENGRVTNLTKRNPGPDHHPAWSPDGRRLAYLSEHVCGTCYTADDPWEVWVLNVRTRSAHRISGEGFLAPVWAPPK